MKYREFQTGWFVIIPSMTVLIVLIIVKFVDFGFFAMGSISFGVTTGLIALIILLFYGMRTTISQSEIVVQFGIGLISRRVNVREIKSVEVVQNKWYYGLGLRKIPQGTLYNIHGLDAVEIQFQKSEDCIRIGTQQPQQLLKMILALME